MIDGAMARGDDAEPLRSRHWDDIYRKRSTTDVSWYQAEPEPSFTRIQRLAPGLGAPIIDVGGGASFLVDRLLDAGFTNITVLDVSDAALAHARARLGTRAPVVRWIVGDITRIAGLRPQAIWHDRAVFHFLTATDDRRRYVELAARTVPVAGHVLVATFAADGPQKCSGLPVVRYDAATLAREFEPCFRLEQADRYIHPTPAGGTQPFTFCDMVRV